MRWEWIIAAVAVVFIIRVVWFSVGNARMRRSSRYLTAATSVMKETSQFIDQFGRLDELDNSQIAVAALRLQELSHQVRSWNPPPMDRERHRHLINIVTTAAAAWEGAPNISVEEANARADRTFTAQWDYLKTRGWQDPYSPPPRKVCEQTRISAFLFGNRC